MLQVAVIFFLFGRWLITGIAEIVNEDAWVYIDENAGIAGVVGRKAFEAPGSVKGRGTADGGEDIILV